MLSGSSKDSPTLQPPVVQPETEATGTQVHTFKQLPKDPEAPLDGIPLNSLIQEQKLLPLANTPPIDSVKGREETLPPPTLLPRNDNDTLQQYLKRHDMWEEYEMVPFCIRQHPVTVCYKLSGRLQRVEVKLYRATNT